MNIVLCIKQVPDTSDIKWTENNTISREGVESIINPLDEYIIELALRIKSKIEDTKITAISMGPMQADKVLKRAISLGCDSGILLCDKKFAGADTFATSQTLASAIRSKLPEFDLVMLIYISTLHSTWIFYFQLNFLRTEYQGKGYAYNQGISGKDIPA